MKYPQLSLPLLLAGLALLSVSSAMAATPAKSGKSSMAPKAQSSLREVDYPTLENKIGEKLVIDTANDTTRSGVLVRYTNVSLTIRLGQESGGIELAIPRTGIEKVRIEIAPADPLFLDEKAPNEGDSGAKKN